MMTIKHSTALFAILAIVSCGQASSQDTPTPASTTPAAPAVGGSLAGPAPTAPPTSSTTSNGWAESDDETLAAEKFGDGARAFATVRETLLKNYFADGITEDDLYRAATAGMLEKLDPKMKKWNRLLTAKEMAELKNDLKGEVVGIGIHIAFDPASGHIDVLAALPRSPAERAGLMSGDKIVSVNGKLYKGMKTKDVVYDIRGKAGEPVTLSVLRGDKLIPFTVTRDKVLFDQPSHALLADNLGYVSIPSFTEKTPSQVKDALLDLSHQNPQAIVVDLRMNQGGSFDSAVSVAELFLTEGTGIVNLKKKSKEEEKFVAKGNGILTSLPMAVLISSNTSSGAEFVTGALQEGRHARIVGTHTHGKWSVQSLDELPNGFAYKYTVSLFKTPSGRSFDGTGLVPEVEVAMDERDIARANAAKTSERLGLDVQLRTAKELLVRK
jgi:carboxyl-terminal processing protease